MVSNYTTHSITHYVIRNSWTTNTDVATQWLNSAGMGRNGVPPPVSGVPPPEIAVPPPKVVVPPPGNDVPSPFGGKSLKLLPPEVRFYGLNAPNTISAGARRPRPRSGRLQRLPRTIGRGPAHL